MLDFEILRLVNLSIDCSCIALLTPAVIMSREFVFHPLFVCYERVGHIWCVCA